MSYHIPESFNFLWSPLFSSNMHAVEVFFSLFNLQAVELFYTSFQYIGFGNLLLFAPMQSMKIAFRLHAEKVILSECFIQNDRNWVW